MRSARKVSRSAAAAVAACILASGTAVISSGSTAYAASCGGGQSQLQQIPASSQSLSGSVPVIFVHGINSDAGMWNANSVAGQVVQMHGVTAWTFNYGSESLDWVTNSSIGPSLADAISCLARASGHSVIIVAHSMGGLAAQYAIGEPGSPAAGHVAEVITLGTPYTGSDVLTSAEDVINGGLSDLGNPTAAFAEALLSLCAGIATNTSINPCWLASALRAPVGTALESGSPEISQLPAWPASLPVLDVAGNMDVFIGVGNTGFHVQPGDGAVTVSSATSHDTADTPYELPCRTTLAGIFGASCFHTSLPYDKQITAAVEAAIRERMAPIDWNNRQYALTCDNIVQTPVNATFSGGTATTQGPGIGPYNQWDLSIAQVAHGNLPTLGDVTAVLFNCSPQPSNFSVRELRIYHTADGSEIGPIPPLPANGGALPAVYNAGSITIANGHVSADVMFYGPGDSHASGPSVPGHLSWSWNGQEFVTDASPGTACTSAVLSSALRAANVPLILPENWVVQGYACQSGYALAALGGIGYPDDAVFKQQGAAWTFVYVLGEFNSCVTEQNGTIIHGCKGGPSQALLQSLIHQASTSSP